MIKDLSEKFGAALPAKEYMETFPPLYHAIIFLLLHFLFFIRTTF
jgi:hypothetical protein